jgi:hypothetical protein
MASMKTVRVDIRCSKKPVVGMTTAMVSMNAVVSHCTVRAEISRSTINRGSATLMIVSFKITTNAATSRIAMTWRSRAGSRSEAPACWLVVLVTRTHPYFIDAAYDDCAVRGCTATLPYT